MLISILDSKCALAAFAISCTTTIALQNDLSLARVAAESPQTADPTGESVGGIAAEPAKARHTNLSVFLHLLRSRQQRHSLDRVSRRPGEDNVLAVATPSEEDRVALEFHIFLIATLVLILIFGVASCCATADGPSNVNMGPTGSVLGRSCFAFGDVGQKPLPSRRSRQRLPDSRPHFQAVEHLHVCPHALKVGTSSWPFTITDPHGTEVFHAKIVDDESAYISNLLRRTGSDVTVPSSPGRINGNSSTKSLEISEPDGTPLIALTSRLQIFSMRHRGVVGKLVAKAQDLYELNCIQGWSPNVFIQRLPTGAFLVLPQGVHFPLACATSVYTFPRERIEIAFGSDASSHPTMRQTCVAVLLGLLVFEGHLSS